MEGNKDSIYRVTYKILQQAACSVLDIMYAPPERDPYGKELPIIADQIALPTLPELAPSLIPNAGGPTPDE